MKLIEIMLRVCKAVFNNGMKKYCKMFDLYDYMYYRIHICTNKSPIAHIATKVNVDYDRVLVYIY